MKAQYALICELFREGRNGMVDTLGLFDRFFTEHLPVRHPGFNFVALVVAESEDDLGSHAFEVVVEAPAQQKMASIQGKVSLKPTGGSWLGAARLNLRLENPVFTFYGKYHLRLLLGGKEIASHPLTVALPEKAPPGP